MANYKDIKYQFPTSAITSGTFADARISSGSVTQHVTATDLQPVKADITALALREATNESSAAFNLPNSFIETFTDDTNLGTQTDGDRVSGYWGTALVETGLVFFTDGGESESSGQFTNKVTGVNGTIAGDLGRNTTSPKFGTYSHYFTNNSSNERDNYASFPASSDWSFGTGDFGFDGWLKIPNNSYEYVLIGLGSNNTTAGNFYFRFNEWAGNRVGSFVVFSGGSAIMNAYTGTSAYSDDTWFHFAVQRNAGVIRMFVNGVSQTVTVSVGDDNVSIGNSSGGLYIGKSGISPQGMYGYLDALRIYKGTYKYWADFTPDSSQPVGTTTNATGTLIQSANAVGSNKTKVGGTFLYKDNAGTATLGSANDLAIYFSCNGGTNWTEAAGYTAITPVYSTGIKQVRLSETTCTGGTDVRYKAVWANQSTGSKETQLHGIGINY